MSKLPTFSSLEKRLAYKNLRSQLILMLDENPEFWNWKLSSYVTEPTLRKVFAINSHLIYVKNIEGAIIEFGCHDGTKQRLICHLLQLNKMQKAFIGFDSFLGYKPGVMSPNYNLPNNLFVVDPKTVQNNYRTFLQVSSLLYGGGNLSSQLIPGVLPEAFMDSEWAETKTSLVYFDLQDVSATRELFLLITENVVRGGLLIFEGYKLPFFNELDFIEEILSSGEYIVLDNFDYKIPYSLVLTKLN
jgi:hypothetical protein